MERSKKVSLAMLILMTIIVQLLLPIIENISYAAESETGTKVYQVTYTITATLSEDGHLTIQGTGAMEDYNSSSEQPWKDERKNIKTVTIMTGVTSIGVRAFSDCSSLTSIKIQEGVTSIGDLAFESCWSLTSIEIPEGVTSIEFSAFSGCSSLTSIEIPEGVTSIGVSAFSGCSSLTSIEIPESVTRVGDSVFSGCSLLEEIKVNKNNNHYSNNNDYGVLYNKDKTIIIAYPAGKKDENYRIPEGVTSIGNSAFESCSSLTSIEIPGSVTSIGSYAFYRCSSLTNIEIPESVISIGNSAFESCSSLTNIEIPESVISIGNHVFEWCGSLTSIEIPEGITSIGNYAFYYCVSLTSIEIPESVTSIGNYAFEGCSSLTSIEIPKSITKIGDAAFYNCSSLTNIEIPEGIADIGKNAFSKVSIIKISSLESDIDLPNILTRTQKVEDILYSEEGFDLTNCEIEGEKIKIISSDLEAIIKVKSGKLKNLSYIILKNKYDISKNADGSIIATLSEDGELKIDGMGEMRDYGYNSVPWNKAKKQIKRVIIVNGIENIGEDIFSLHRNLESVQIPESVTDIGDWAFYGCRSLTSVEIPERVISIGEHVFDGCSSLTSIEIPESVKSIENYAFYGCSSLTNIEIPESVISIGNYVFYECSNLTSIEIPKRVMSIRTCAFYGCRSLTRIVIPNRVTDIGYSVFEYCNKLNIVCKTGSIAETYAKEKQINYILDDNGPSLEILPNASAGTKKIEAVVKATDEIAGLREESLKYLWSTKSENVEKEEIATEFKNEEVLQKTGEDGIYYLWVYGEDLLGNETIISSKSFKLDNTVPEYQVEYSSKEPTNKNITVTITANEELQEVEGWTLLEDKMKLTKTYDKNTEEEIVIKDLVGNEITVEVLITNIDKVIEKPEGIYSPQELTKENVTVTITVNEEIQEIEGWQLSEDKMKISKIYEENAKETVTIKDLAGNETTVEVVITNIDKVIEKPQVIYSTQELTKENVTVKIKATEEIQEVEGWQLSEDKRELSKTYEENEKETVTIKDLVGNETTVEVVIANIDKVIGKPQVLYSNQELTKENVTVKIKATEEIQEVEGWKLSEDKKELTKIYNRNTKKEVTIKDLAGNETTVKVEITNIEDYFYIEGYEITKDGYVLEIPEQTKIEDFISKIKTNQEYRIYEMRKQEGTTEQKEVEGLIKTGQVIKIDGKVICTLVVKGDTTGDGRITASDLNRMKNHILENYILSNLEFKAADFNGDDQITARDLNNMKNYILNR